MPAKDNDDVVVKGALDLPECRLVDVLVTDLLLRDGEGSMLSGHCAARGIPTITLTGHEFHIDQAAQDRPPPLIDKPFRIDDLQSVLDAVAVYSESARAAA